MQRGWTSDEGALPLNGENRSGGEDSLPGDEDNQIGLWLHWQQFLLVTVILITQIIGRKSRLHKSLFTLADSLITQYFTSGVPSLRANLSSIRPQVAPF